MAGRIVMECVPCGLGMDVPDSPLGQAMHAQFVQEHEGHVEPEGVHCRTCGGNHRHVSEELAAHGDPGS